VYAEEGPPEKASRMESDGLMAFALPRRALNLWEKKGKKHSPQKGSRTTRVATLVLHLAHTASFGRGAAPSIVVAPVSPPPPLLLLLLSTSHILSQLKGEEERRRRRSDEPDV